MSRITRPVCVEHNVEMRCLKNGTLVLVNAEWGPYEVQSGDQYQCPIGNERVVVGFASEAIARHDEPKFEGWAEKAEVTVTP